MNKCTLMTLLAVGLLSVVHANILKTAADDAIYIGINVILKAKHPDDPKLVKCMSDDFKGSKVADKFYTPELLWNAAKLENEIEPYVKEAEYKCKIGLFLQSPIGLFILIAILLVIILISCLIIKCICC